MKRNDPRGSVSLSATEPSCRGREVLERVGDKWSLHVISVLNERTMRFGELRRSVDGISQRMLTVTLRSLERDGIVHRTLYPEIPPRVEYGLTALGKTLLEAVSTFIQWAETHVDEIDAARAEYDARNGQANGATGATG
ncbi:transcriptional regulator [Actinomadura sp. NBRC 104412]|uniref:winged helix-turn-helix transcriptional regulator n=1 Tax=Actinomadura sp. NBRC 104412 TaxID=3032203 RepID=UPI0024A37256|nr:helix-turn-helix domain-containing protein [Actinomadura sp. NBRC 104412]GLZ02795.1 transcriptional regulator [Actinomadura sp. NBRC 104412]